jgi:hypothetical protein
MMNWLALMAIDLPIYMCIDVLCFVGSTRIGASGCEEFSWIGAMPSKPVKAI